MHLFVDISGHGFGHLAISAPVLNRLGEIRPDVQLTVRSSLPEALLRSRITADFRHIAASSDFGYRMINSRSVDLASSWRDYTALHADWTAQVDREAAFLSALGAERVLSNVAYLPLAGAAQLGLPAAALCSLNWADLFAHFFGSTVGAASIHSQMQAAYASAQVFLRATPGMAMPALHNILPVAPIAAIGKRHDLNLAGEKAVLVAMGGISDRLPVETWPRVPGMRWIVPDTWGCPDTNLIPASHFGLSFTDLLCSVDAVVTKPGYGMFTEACCNGTPVIYVRRADWPEQDSLIDWLQENGRCLEISEDVLYSGVTARQLAALHAQPVKPLPRAEGAEQAAAWLDTFCRTG